MNENVKIADRLEALFKRHGWYDNARHEEYLSILAALRAPSQAQGTYSIEDMKNWKRDVLILLGKFTAFPVLPDVADPNYGIAAWKSKQLDAKEGEEAMDTQADTRASMRHVVPVNPPGTGQLFPAAPPPAECRVFDYLKTHPRMSLGWQTGYGWFVVDFYSKDPAIMGHDVNDLAKQLEAGGK